MKKKIFQLFLLIISLITILGAGIYYFYALNWPGIIITLILLITSFFVFTKLNGLRIGLLLKNWIPAKTGITQENKKTRKNKIYNLSSIIYHFIYLAFLLFTFYLLLATRTSDALTSPWQVVSTNFFIAYALATASLILVIIKKSSLSLYLIMAHYFLSFSVLWIVFKIGYGFDPFIHQATLDLIDKQGAVEPKTFYYLGQYALEIITHKIFFIPISLVDNLLVPIMAAVTIPPAIFLFLKRTLKSNQLITYNLSLIILLIFPFSIFTLTVPQNLAYLFLILTIFIGLAAEKKFELFLTGLLALTAFVIHPIAGIPAILFAIALFIKKYTPKTPTTPNPSLGRRGEKFILAAIFILTTFSLPMAFYLANHSKSNNVGSETAIPSSIKFSLASVTPKQENLILNFVQLFSFNQWLWLSLLAIAGIFISWRTRKENSNLLSASSFSISLLTAFLITKNFLNFSYLISYERGDFLERILILSFIFLLPGIVLTFFKLIKKISQQNNFIKISWTIFGIFLITVSLYCSYPRKDNYFNSRSYSSSQNDFKAVEWIEKDAHGTPYVVLANQQVSAVALKTFGFNRYYKNNIYFYPIPTGESLYQIYLKMVYEKPSRVNALKATDLTNVDAVYFVINKYWWAFDKIIEEAKIEAGSFQNINNEIYIFKYQK